MKTSIPLLLILLSITFVQCSDNTGETPSSTFKVTLTNTGQTYKAIKSGAFTTPESKSNPAAIGSGEAYEFSFTAPPGARLTMATMFVQSNDWFYASGEQGIPLYKSDGTKNTGNVTSMIDLYDAGTEMDQEPGTGSNQAPRQSGLDTGPADSTDMVKKVDDSKAPANNDVIKVTIQSTSTYGFTVRIENVSSSSTLQTSEGSKSVPLSPGVFAVHQSSQTGLLFKVGSSDFGEGLESLAEDGKPGTLDQHLSSITGITPVYSPGVYAVYEGSNPIFKSGEKAMGNGIQALAEDGKPGMLKAALNENGKVVRSGIFNTPAQSQSAGPLTPGKSYSFTFEAEQGKKLTFATMYVQSNDWFYAPIESGISLFMNGSPMTGTVTDQIHLWDAGTEKNEEPGIGQYQAPRQSQLDSGPKDSNSKIRMVGDSFPYMKHLKVEIKMVK